MGTLGNYLSIESTPSEVLNDAADVLQVGCVATDENLVVTAWNRWMEAATGRSTAEAVGAELLALFPMIADTASERAFRRALAGEAVVFAHSFHHFLLPMPAPPGYTNFDFMQQSARIVPLLREDDVVGVVALIDDVTERIARERALDEAKERAETANKTKSDFLAAMSHELRTPLNAILGYTDLLESEIMGPLNDKQKEQLQRVVQGSWHLINIIDEILTFSRLEAQRYSITLEKTDAAAILRDVAGMLEMQASQKGITLAVTGHDNPIWIDTDPLRLKQILLNVAGNAVKFTDVGTVRVRLEQNAQNVSFTVSDTGPGIPPKYREAVFEPFVQVDQSYTRRKGGTGLGLPLSRSLVQLLGGNLQLANSDGPGSTFVVTLPRKLPPLRAVPA